MLYLEKTTQLENITLINWVLLCFSLKRNIVVINAY